MRCGSCGKDAEHIQEHHILPRVLGGIDAPSNIAKICPSCHDLIHSRSSGTHHRHLTMVGQQKARLIGRHPGKPRKYIDESMVLSLISDGWRIDSIANRMNISTATVRRIISGQRSMGKHG